MSDRAQEASLQAANDELGPLLAGLSLALSLDVAGEQAVAIALTRAFQIGIKIGAVEITAQLVERGIGVHLTIDMSDPDGAFDAGGDD